MKIVVFGTGTVGAAVGKALTEAGHDIVTVGRRSGDYQADISDPASLKALFSAGAPAPPRRQDHALGCNEPNLVTGTAPILDGSGRSGATLAMTTAPAPPDRYMSMPGPRKSVAASPATSASWPNS